jgi:putative sterol carrier protein
MFHSTTGIVMVARVESVQGYFDTLPERFVASASEGLDAVFQFEISGDEGGTWHVHVKDGALEIFEGAHENPSAKILAKDQDYLKICNGEMNGLRAVMTRKMKIEGNLVLARKMQNLFPTGNI